MPSSKSLLPGLLRAGLLAVVTGFMSIAVSAQTSTTGIIEGRVSHPATGENLELARITVEGTALEAFTDADGQYRLANVPAGPVRVRAFRTGVAPQTQSVTVATGRSTTLNFALESFGGRPDPGRPIKLDQFTVGASKEMDGSAIAINTQRFAPNVMSVVSADEYAAMTEGASASCSRPYPAWP